MKNKPSIREAVEKKWGPDEEKINIWFAKFSRARRLYLQKLWNKDPHCVYCGRETLSPELNTNKQYDHRRDRSTYEHMIPKIRGGSEARSNAALSCARCNHTKLDMTHEEFKQSLIDNPLEIRSKRRAQQQLLRQKSLLAKRQAPETIIRSLKISWCLALLMCDPTIRKMVDTELSNMQLT